jgi:hypothetical protein
LQIPLDPKIKELADLPYTISFIIRKRQQIDNLNELPKDKKPPDSLIWGDDSDALDDWLDRMFDPKKGDNNIEFTIKPGEIER